MPPLPRDAALAAAAGPEVALAHAIEQARRGGAAMRASAAGLERSFVQALSLLVAQALRSPGGDPAFQAWVMAGQEPAVAEYLALTATERADRRRVRTAVDAFAHPGKWQGRAAAMPERLARLHADAQAGDWQGLRASAESLAGTGWQAAAEPVLAEPALSRLERLAGLRAGSAVQRYLALVAARGPLADSAQAAAHGRAAARSGAAVEQATAEAFLQLARHLEASGGGPHRVARGLKPRSGLPRAVEGAKDEWDVVLLRGRRGADPFDVVLVAEAKASAASAVSDWPRLRRGLQRLSRVPAGSHPVFLAEDGEVRLHADSLRALSPPERGLPGTVIYCCTGDDTRASALSPPARAMLLQQPATLAYAAASMRGDAPDPALLSSVWHALAREPRLRPVLEQYETARIARESMLHPDDLQAAVARFGA